MTSQFNLAEKVEEINMLLESGEPGNISFDDYKDKSGYAPQPIFDAINTVLGPEKWGFEEVSLQKDNETTPKLAVYCVRVWIGDKECNRTAYGQSRITSGDLGDAFKGAQTDAIKKALSYFSIGNRAYLGLLVKNGKGRPLAPTAGTTAPVAPARNGNGAERPITPKQVEFLTSLIEKKGFTIDTIYTKYGVTVTELTAHKASEIIDTLQKMPS